MTLEEYVSSLRASLCRRWKGAIVGGEVLPLCGMTDFKYIQSHMIRDRIKKKDLTADPHNGFSLQVDDNPTECWVSPSLSRQQYTRLFSKFLKDTYKISYKEHNTRRDKADRYQIDHAHCCESVRMKSDASFVLLSPVRQRINGGWATVEKYLANDNIHPVSTQVANYFTFAKLSDIQPPSVSASINLSEEAEKLVDAMREFLDPEEKALDIKSVLELLEQVRRGANNYQVRRR